MKPNADLSPLADIYKADSFHEARQRLGAYFGLDADAPANVTARVLNDQRFAALVASMGKFPEWRQKFLNDPFNAKFEVPDADTDQGRTRSLTSTATLVKKAAFGLLKWGTQGFFAVDPVVKEKRAAACTECDQAVEAPKTKLYEVANLGSSDTRMCDACGCLLAKKIAMPTESCPLAHPDDPTLTRWGEPVEKASEGAA